MFVTQTDQLSERQILNKVIPHVPSLWGFTFIHLKNNPSAIFDFRGLRNDRLVAELDVKVRDIKSTDFNEYFISADKVFHMRNNPRLSFHIIYFFEKDKKARVYNLWRSPLVEKEIDFTHKRSGERLKKKVFCIPADSWIFDCYLL